MSDLSDLPSLRNLLSLLNPRTYHLFISHAWNYDDEYRGVVRLLGTDTSFKWNDLSVDVENPLPQHPVLHKSSRTIMRQLEEKIRQADCLVVLAAMYLNHSGWIQSEIEMAWEYKKPIIAIAPKGQERLPDALSKIGIAELVRWNSSSLISAIRRQVPLAHTPSTAPVSSPLPSFAAAMRSALVLNELMTTRILPPDPHPVPTLAAVSVTPFDRLQYLQDLVTKGNSSGFPRQRLHLWQRHCPR